ncbi:hypothetical protein [Photorhabdus antumapuensis]|nr:hypothetical protein [Photorhabdus antumapuensis]MCA6220874.1 hypothetical protein [Photorhabdus antumapuensis]
MQNNILVTGGKGKTISHRNMTISVLTGVNPSSLDIFIQRECHRWKF